MTTTTNIQLLISYIHASITVELGRTKKKVKDILGWGEGSIIELDKPSTEPVRHTR
jgi:flagellar motor switch protein FliN/FliY